MAGAAADAPKEYIADISRNLGGILGEAVCCGTDVAKVTSCGEREDAEVFDLLLRRWNVSWRFSLRGGDVVRGGLTPRASM